MKKYKMTARTPMDLIRNWLAPCLVILLAIRVAWYIMQSDSTLPNRSLYKASSNPQQAFYYYNEVSGQVQWEDPGDVPYEDEEGSRYWILSDGSKTWVDPTLETHAYAWVEQFSQDMNKPYFFNLETKESTWERPPDLAWRRIQVMEDDS